MDPDLLDFYLTHWGTADLVPLRDYIRNASKAELLTLREQIKAHAKERNENVRLLSEAYQRSHPHALASVNWELRKRSKTSMWIHDAIFPAKRWWAGFWSGVDVIPTDDFGPVPIKRDRGDSLFHVYGLKRWALKIIILPVLRYLGRNANWIVPMIVAALVAIYVASNYGISLQTIELN